MRRKKGGKKQEEEEDPKGEDIECYEVKRREQNGKKKRNPSLKSSFHPGVGWGGVLYLLNRKSTNVNLECNCFFQADTALHRGIELDQILIFFILSSQQYGAM